MRRLAPPWIGGLVAAAVCVPAASGAAQPAAPLVTRGPSVSWSLTDPTATATVAPQVPVTFGPDRTAPDAVTVHPRRTYQRVLGAGAALTESAAVLLDRLPPTQRRAALVQLFDRRTGAGISVLRVPLGASDFALSDYTYDDVTLGSDPSLAGFSLARDREHVIPLLLEAARLNPSLQVVLAPWSPPAWMKDSGTTHGGSLLTTAETAYADYLARAVEGYVAAGVPVRAVTVANEPGHTTSAYPSTLMDVAQQGRVAALLRTRLDDADLERVGILAHDHNWDDTTSPIQALTGQDGDAYTGAAFHCYGGDVSAQSTVSAAAPGAEIWTTECSGGDWSSSFSGDLRWGARHMLVGAFRHHSIATLWWNLALDPTGGPTNGGCTGCRGVVTIDPSRGTVAPNVEYWLLTHVGRFLPAGSTRVATTSRTATGIESVAFLTPSRSKVLLLLNDSDQPRAVTVRWSGMSTQLRVPGGGLVTATW